MNKPTCESCVYWVKGHIEYWSNPVSLKLESKHNPACKRYPKISFKCFDNWCGEHPQFPAYLESLKPSLLPQTIVCPKCGHMCTTDDAEIGKPCPRVD
jgi:hypothetical protein